VALISTDDAPRKLAIVSLARIVNLTTAAACLFLRREYRTRERHTCYQTSGKQKPKNIGHRVHLVN
jgi:hypothetical protein